VPNGEGNLNLFNLLDYLGVLLFEDRYAVAFVPAKMDT
jgi:hypothetical protein